MSITGYYLENDLDALIEKTVYQQGSTMEGHHREKKCEEPGETDCGNDAKILHVYIESRQVETSQVFKHTLIHQSS